MPLQSGLELRPALQPPAVLHGGLGPHVLQPLSASAKPFVPAGARASGPENGPLAAGPAPLTAGPALLEDAPVPLTAGPAPSFPGPSADSVRARYRLNSASPSSCKSYWNALLRFQALDLKERNVPS